MKTDVAIVLISTKHFYPMNTNILRHFEFENLISLETIYTIQQCQPWNYIFTFDYIYIRLWLCKANMF